VRLVIGNLMGVCAELKVLMGVALEEKIGVSVTIMSMRAMRCTEHIGIDGVTTID
jgi:hypothetical protein